MVGAQIVRSASRGCLPVTHRIHLVEIVQRACEGRCHLFGLFGRDRERGVQHHHGMRTHAPADEDPTIAAGARIPMFERSRVLAIRLQLEADQEPTPTHIAHSGVRRDNRPESLFELGPPRGGVLDEMIPGDHADRGHRGNAAQRVGCQRVDVDGGSRTGFAERVGTTPKENCG